MEEIANRSSLENVSREVPEFQTLTQEAIKEKTRGFIAPLTRQLEELIQLVQGMTTSRHQDSYPRTELSTTSGTAIPQSDSMQKDKRANRLTHKRVNFTYPIREEFVSVWVWGS